MGLLDRLKPQPRWKHPDPQVRMAGVRDVPEDGADILIAIARDDAEASVRRAAVGRLLDPAALSEIARTDPDETVRGEASAVLKDLAIGTIEDVEETAALEALGGLAEPRHLAAVAKEAASEVVARSALARLHDPKLLGGVGRQSIHAAVRLDAVRRLDDPAELAAVAMKSEYKEPALSALERVQDPEMLQHIANRARNKVAARRARAMLRTLEQTPAAPSPEELEAERQAERIDLCQLLESLAAAGDWKRGVGQLAEAEARWRELGREGQPPAEELDARFAAATQAVRGLLARHEAERAEEERRREAVAQALAARTALCERVEQLEGEGLPENLSRLEAEWRELPAFDEPEARPIQERFEHACRAAADREQARRQAEAAAAALDGLLDRADALRQLDDAGEALRRWDEIGREWRRISKEAEPSEARRTRFDELQQHFAAHRSQLDEQRTRQHRDALARVRQKAEHFERLADSGPIGLKEGDRALRNLKSELEALPQSLLTRPEQEELGARLRAVQERLLPKVQELREADDWQRWINAGVQEELCTRMEALLQVDDSAHAVREMRHLQQEWTKVKAAPRNRSEALWHRFKTAQDAVRARCESYFAQLSAEREQNFQRKTALCERAEALSESTDWIRTADEIKAMQAEWKTIGPALHEKTTWERFRTACDRFFTRRKEDLSQRKRVWSDNLARKNELCRQAEALADSTDWDRAFGEIRRLQAEWRTIGPVQKNRSEAVWNRFRAACDRFFERYRDRDRQALAGVAGDREQICGELEALASADEAPANLYETLKGLRTRWQQAGSAGREQARSLQERYDAALRAAASRHAALLGGTEFDLEANRRKLERLCQKVEAHLGPAEPAAGRNPAQTLAAQLREALAANTIGGRVDDDARLRAAVDEVREAQAAWKRVGPVSAEAERTLEQRFHTACNRFFDQRRHAAKRAEPARREPAKHAG